MADLDSSSSLVKPTDVPNELNNETRETSAECNNFQDGGHVASSVATSVLQLNSSGIFVPTASVAQVVSTTDGMVQKDFPALLNTTKPIPPSVFSYRFASPTSNQTPYYVSSDIVLSGGIAQQTRRRIVHNEVERRRKDKINNWIMKLSDVVPHCKWGKQSKNIVLEKAVEYITQITNQLKEFSDLQQREQKLAQEVQHLKSRLGSVTKENKLLKDLLKKHGIAVPRKIVTMPDCSSLGADTSGSANDSVTMTTAGSKSRATPALVTMTTSKHSQAPSQVTINPPSAVATMVTQVPITSASVAGSSTKEQSKKESIAYVAPFIIATNPVSMTTSTTVAPSPVVQVATPLVLQNVISNPGQPELNQLQRNTTSVSNYLANPHQSFNPQLANNLVYSSATQPLQTVNMPVSSSQVLQNSHAGFSQHSVAAIMKVALQPGMSSSPINVVNAIPLATSTMGNNTTAILNVQPAVINSPVVIPSTTTMSTSTHSILSASNSVFNQQAGAYHTAGSQSDGLSTFYVMTAPNQSLGVSKVAQINGSSQQQKESSNVASKCQGNVKTKKSGSANKAQTKSSSRTQNTKRSLQSKTFPENKTSSATNKRGAGHLTVTNSTGLAKRTNTCNSHESQGNMNICQPQEDIMTLQTFNVNALISGITPQGSSVANNMTAMVPTRDDCGKTSVQASSIGMSQAVQVPRLSHSIASLAGLSQNIGQSQPSTDLHQQVSQLPPGNLSFSAESLLASNEVVLPNIPHITTTSVPESNTNQQRSLMLAVVPSVHSAPNVVPSVHSIPNAVTSVHSIPNEQSVHSNPNQQSHTQSFSNYSAEALIGGNELMGDSVIAQDTQIQSRPSRTTYSDFSAESLIGSSDLNSSLSYAIDNLISSRSDPNYNSSAMVSVNPNLLHSVKSNVSHDAGPNPLQALAALPDLVEQKSSMPSSQPTVLFNCNISNSAFGGTPATLEPTQFTFVNSNSNRRSREGTDDHQGVGQNVNSTNNVSVSSASFLKHSVDSITSSFYAVSNAGSSFSLGPISTSSSSFQPQGLFGAEPSPGGQLSFGSMANPFSPTRSFFTHSSTMGSFV